ncbi:MAG: AAA family ATPase [bacterium]|nr:AAA family ATPase [bacterium]
MYKQITIKNFRGIRELTVPLSQFNIFTGKNNAGKSTILEALFLSVLQDARAADWIAGFRGAINNWQKLEAWRYFFSIGIDKPSVEISLVDDHDQTKQLSINLYNLAAQGKTFIDKEFEGTIIHDTIDEYLSTGLLFTSNQTSNIYDYMSSIRVVADQSNPIYEKNQEPLQPIGRVPYLHSAWTGFESTAREYSKLKIEMKNRIVFDAIKAIEPRLKSISIEAPTGVPSLYVDIGLNRLLPISFLGDGTIWISDVTTVIASSEVNAVLLDEVDSGLHFSVMKEVWKHIHKIAKECNTQIFATTHSRECIMAAHEAFIEDEANGMPYELSVHKLARYDDETRVATFGKETLTTSYDLDLEVR